MARKKKKEQEAESAAAIGAPESSDATTPVDSLGSEPAREDDAAPLSDTADQDVAEFAEGEIPEELVLKPEEIRAIVEALTFVSKEPVTMKELARVLKGVEKSAIAAEIEVLKKEYSVEHRGLQFIEVAGGYQIASRPEHSEWVRELLDPKSPTRLTSQSLETLAVIAYKQPVTLPEVIELRGIKSGGVVKTLLERRLIKIVGRKEVVGRPLLYGTTREFLLQFGLKDLSDLPKIEDFAEILGEDIDLPGLKRALESPRPTEMPLFEEDPQSKLAFDESAKAQSLSAPLEEDADTLENPAGAESRAESGADAGDEATAEPSLAADQHVVDADSGESDDDDGDGEEDEEDEGDEFDEDEEEDDDEFDDEDGDDEDADEFDDEDDDDEDDDFDEDEDDDDDEEAADDNEDTATDEKDGDAPPSRGRKND